MKLETEKQKNVVTGKIKSWHFKKINVIDKPPAKVRKAKTDTSDQYRE